MKKSSSKIKTMIDVSFEETNSHFFKDAIIVASKLANHEYNNDRHCFRIPIPFEDPQKWSLLNQLLTRIVSWKNSFFTINENDFDGKTKLLTSLSKVVKCYYRKDCQGIKFYCCGRGRGRVGQFNFWGCHFLGQKNAIQHDGEKVPWYYFGNLSDDYKTFRIDKEHLYNTLSEQARSSVSQFCPAFSIGIIDFLLSELPDSLDVGTQKEYCLRYSDDDPNTPVGVRKVELTQRLQFCHTQERRPALKYWEFENEEGEVCGNERSVPDVKYSDVAGQEEAIQVIRDICETPLKYPEYFEEIGIKPQRAAILYGPPGNGKTLLAKAVASESDAHLEIINGPEILSKYVGESEEIIRKIFLRAKMFQPSVILFDEIDALVMNRQMADHQHQAQLVSQILVLLDGLEERGNIIIIATTNRLDSIDPAILRPGRFDYHIEIKLPNRAGRMQILRLHTPTGYVESDHILELIADSTNNWSGAELAALCREVGLIAIKRSLAENISAKNINITSKDFMTAFESIKSRRKA